MTAANGVLRKVVLARSLRLAADAPLHPDAVLRRLAAADPSGYGYLVDLSTAGDAYAGAVLVGASPELLVARDGDRITCRPFAGSAPRSPTRPSTPPTRPHWPIPARTAMNTNWSSTSCVPHSSRCAANLTSQESHG